MNTQVRFTAPGEVKLVSAAMPVCRPDQLLVRTLYSLISPGTERAFLWGLNNTSRQYPMGAGYSTVAEIVECGAAVDGWQVGQRIAVPIQHQRLAAVSAAHCHLLPDALDSRTATFFHLGAIALQGIRKARIELGEGVAVLGAGIVGLLAMQWARLAGARPVLTLDVPDARLPLAEQLGADAALSMTGDYRTQVQALCGNARPEVVVDATGHPAAVTSAFDLIAPLGRLVLLGSTRGNTPDVNFYRDVHKTGLTLIGAHNSIRPAQDRRPGLWTVWEDEALALRCLAAGRLQVDPLVSHTFSWEDAPAAYAELKAAQASTLGIMLEWAA